MTPADTQQHLRESIERLWSELEPLDLEKKFLDEIAALEREGQQATPEYTAYANELGTLYRVTARYAEGEAVFKKALDSIRAQEGEGDRFATCLDNLAELYRLDGRLDECDQALDYACRLFTDRASDEFAACLNYQGHARMARGRFAEAAELYREALAITIADHPDTIDAATAYQNVATACHLAGGTDEAKRLLNRALEVYEANDLRINAHFVGLLNTLAVLSAQTGDGERARMYVQRAVAALDHCNVNPTDAAIVRANAARLLGSAPQESR